MLLIVISGFAAANITVISERAGSIIDPHTKGYTDRAFVWKGAWQMFLDHPVSGVRLGNFQEIYLERYLSPQAVEKLGHAHNNYLHILAEKGIIGFAGFMAMFAYFLYYLHTQAKAGNLVALGVFLGTIALLLQGLTEFNFGDSAVIRMFWFLLGLAVAAANIGAKYSEKDTA